MEDKENSRWSKNLFVDWNGGERDDCIGCSWRGISEMARASCNVSL